LLKSTQRVDKIENITRIKSLAPLDKILEMSLSISSNKNPSAGRAF